jgi:hypothetical protein
MAMKEAVAMVQMQTPSGYPLLMLLRSMAAIVWHCIWHHPCHGRWSVVTQAEYSWAVERQTMCLLASEEEVVEEGDHRGCGYMVVEGREGSDRSGSRQRWSTNYAAYRNVRCEICMPPLPA